MTASFRTHAVGAMVLSFALATPLLRAGAPSTCDQLSKDVREAVAKEPAKVLMIVEDALVINESCACEIVKAAIQASNADQAMVQQIVQTAIAVAPKMAAVIAECAAAVAPQFGEAINATVAGKTEKTDRSKEVSEAVAKPETEAPGVDYLGASYIRGIYLIQPAAAGFLSITEDEDEEDQKKEEGKQVEKTTTSSKANSRRTRNLIPLSPSYASAG